MTQRFEYEFNDNRDFPDTFPTPITDTLEKGLLEILEKYQTEAKIFSDEGDFFSQFNISQIIRWLPVTSQIEIIEKLQQKNFNFLLCCVKNGLKFHNLESRVRILAHFGLNMLTKLDTISTNMAQQIISDKISFGPMYGG